MSDAATTFTSDCERCGRPRPTMNGSPDPRHECHPHDVAVTQSGRVGWVEGYRFALDNISDPMVQADRAEFGSGWAGAVQMGGIVVEAGPNPEEGPK